MVSGGGVGGQEPRNTRTGAKMGIELRREEPLPLLPHAMSSPLCRRLWAASAVFAPSCSLLLCAFAPLREVLSGQGLSPGRGLRRGGSPRKKRNRGGSDKRPPHCRGFAGPNRGEFLAGCTLLAAFRLLPANQRESTRNEARRPRSVAAATCRRRIIEGRRRIEKGGEARLSTVPQDFSQELRLEVAGVDEQLIVVGHG